MKLKVGDRVRVKEGSLNLEDIRVYFNVPNLTYDYIYKIIECDTNRLLDDVKVEGPRGLTGYVNTTDLLLVSSDFKYKGETYR